MNDAEDGAARQEEKKEATEEVYGWGNMQVVGTTKEDAENRKRWKQVIC